jgi:hypothetical protein
MQRTRRLIRSTEGSRAEYCLAQESRGIQSFNACMDELERNGQQSTMMYVLIIAGVIAAVYFYNKVRAEGEKAKNTRPDSF